MQQFHIIYTKMLETTLLALAYIMNTLPQYSIYMILLESQTSITFGYLLRDDYRVYNHFHQCEEVRKKGYYFWEFALTRGGAAW